MSIRSFLILIACVPALILGGAKLSGIIIPVPEWRRDYVLRFPLALPPVEAEPLQLPAILGSEDEDRPAERGRAVREARGRRVVRSELGARLVGGGGEAVVPRAEEPRLVGERVAFEATKREEALMVATPKPNDGEASDATTSLDQGRARSASRRQASPAKTITSARAACGSETAT